jgi:hypothetical protein
MPGQLKLNTTGMAHSVLLLFVCGISILLGPFVFISLNASQGELNRLVSVPARVKSTSLKEIPRSNKLWSWSDYSPVVNYDYELSGKHYAGYKIYSSEFRGNKEWAQAILEQYRPDQHIQVWADPNNPAFSCIIKKKNFADYIVPITFTGILCVGALVLIAMFSSPEPVVTSTSNQGTNGRALPFRASLAIKFVAIAFLVGFIYSYYLYFVAEEHPEILTPAFLGIACVVVVGAAFKGAHKKMTKP